MLVLQGHNIIVIHKYVTVMFVMVQGHDMT